MSRDPHDTMLVTPALKNLLVASLVNDDKQIDKGYVHRANKSLNDIMHYNFYHMARRVWRDLTVSDGFGQRSIA